MNRTFGWKIKRTAWVLGGIVAAACIAIQFAAAEAQSVGAQSQVSLRRELRIDGVAQNLVSVSWLVVGRDGRMAVAQGQDRAVVFFDSAGKQIGRFGRAGQGPGEFQSVSSAGYSGDSLWVNDLVGGDRITVVAPNLSLARTFSLTQLQPAPGAVANLPALRPTTPHALYPDGSVLVRAALVRNSRVPPGFDTTGFRLLRVTQSGIIQRPIAHVTPFPDRTVNTRVGDMFVSTVVPHLATPLFRISSRGARMAALTPVYSGSDANTLRFVVYGLNGDTVYARNYPFEPQRLPSAAADDAVAQMVTNLQKSITGGTVPADFREEMRRRVPPVYPPYVDMFIGDDGSAWIGLRHDRNTPRPYMLIDARGNPAGRVSVPVNTSVLAISAAHMWGVERDSLDVQSIVRYRVVR